MKNHGLSVTWCGCIIVSGLVFICPEKRLPGDDDDDDDEVEAVESNR